MKARGAGGIRHSESNSMVAENASVAHLALMAKNSSQVNNGSINSNIYQNSQYSFVNKGPFYR